MIRMKVQCGTAEEEVAFFNEEVITVGRSSKNNLQLPDKKASRKHFLFEMSNNSYRVVDLGSKNGTLVNGKKAETHTVQKGDRIVTGEATIVVLDIGFASDSGKTGSKRAPVPPPQKKDRQGAGGINIKRGPREMPMGLFDYILVAVILVLIIYILGVLAFALKSRTGDALPELPDIIRQD